MKHFVLRRTYEDEKLRLESELVYIKHLNQTLTERIQHGEAYRSRLQEENQSLRGANLRLLEQTETLQEQIARNEFETRDLRLKLGSMEARWNQREVADA
ncbi:MAG: hypothetical protein IJV64_01970 [Oscillospiraceae bacterium]|nr:hypothetical protein [Oscillospiraceae bacterium]